MSGEEVKGLWESHFRPAVLSAFSKADFVGSMDSYGVEEECEAQIHSLKPQTHLAAFKGNRLVGALFGIDSKRDPDQDYADLSWFFASPEMAREDRISIADSIISQAHEMLKRLGYRGVDTMIGTRSGQKFLTKRHGYVKHPSNPFLWRKKF